MARPDQPLSVTIEGLQKIGAPAVPHVAKRLRTQRTTSQVVYSRFYEKLPAVVARRLPPPDIDPVTVRTRAASVLGKLDPCATQATVELANALADPEPQVRSAAAVALGKIGKSDPDIAVPALAAALQDTDLLVRQNACAALGELGAAAASVLPFLRRILQVEKADPELQPFARIALAQIHASPAASNRAIDDASGDPLETALEPRDRMVNDLAGRQVPGQPPTPAPVMVVEPERRHLGLPERPEWREFARSKPFAHRLDLRFPAKKNASEYALFIRQRDVKFEWRIELNGRNLGKLQQNEADLEHAVAVPAGALTEGENRLSIIPSPQIDDIVVGPIHLHYQPLNEILTSSTLTVRVSDSDNLIPIPCRLTIVNEHGALAALSTDPAQKLAARTGVIYTPNGQAKIGLLPGRYQIYAGRGFEYSVSTQSVHLARGATQSLRMQITREVETPGLVACDTHIHTLTLSGHGDATLEERMVTLAAEGIELPIATEHNLHADYGEPARRLGLQRYFTTVTGNEVTTKKGHFNIFPVQSNAPVPDSKIEHWPTLIEQFRRTPNAEVVILNHPRDLHSNFRPFAETNYLAVTGENRLGFDLTFNAVELINSGALQSDLMRLYHDWFGLLNYGLKITGAAGSDSHDVSRYIVGQGRTYVAANDSDPGSIDVSEVVRNFRAGRTYLSMGLLTVLTLEEKFAGGDVATGLGQSMNLKIRVHRPSWTRADRIELFANGTKIAEERLEYQDHLSGVMLRIPRPRHDVFLVAIASGPGVTAPFWAIPKPYQPSSLEWTPRVIGSSAPIWIDGDSDGRFTPARELAQRLIEKHKQDLGKLIENLSTYDQATAAQTASLLHASGRDLSSPELVRLLADAPAPIQQGFREFAEALRSASAR